MIFFKPTLFLKKKSFRETPRGWGGGGGGGYSHFSSYVGLDPASTVKQKISGTSGIPQKIFEI